MTAFETACIGLVLVGFAVMLNIAAGIPGMLDAGKYLMAALIFAAGAFTTLGGLLAYNWKETQ